MTQPQEQTTTPDEMGPDDQAPFGYTIDKATGEKRAKLRPGKQPGTPAKKAPAADEPPVDPATDRAPGSVRAKRSRLYGGGTIRRGRAPKPDPEPLPPFRAGPIAKGVNKIYARAGRILRALDHDLGTAVILTTRKESEDDVTVGEAWEEVARTNDRIRAFLLKVISGGAWGQLVMAHAPIALAMLMKDSVRKRLPLTRLAEAFFEPADGDEDQADAGDAGPTVAGMNLADLQQLGELAQNLMAGAVGRMDGLRSVPPAEWDGRHVEPVAEAS